MNTMRRTESGIVSKGALILCIVICLLSVSGVQAGGGTISFDQTRYGYTNLPQSIACKLCTNLVQEAVQDTKSFVYCAACVKTAGQLINGSLSVAGEAAALKRAFPNNKQSVVPLIDTLRQERRDRQKEGASKEEDDLLTPAKSIRDKVDNVRLACHDCGDNVLYKNAKRHASTHLVKCSCAEYPPAEASDKYTPLVERVRRLAVHTSIARSECCYCQQNVGHINISRHETNCLEREITCPTCQEVMKIGQLLPHVTERALDDHALVDCPLCTSVRSMSGLEFVGHMATHHSPRPQTQGLCPFCQDHKWEMDDASLIGHIAVSHPEHYVRLATYDDKTGRLPEQEESLRRLIATGMTVPTAQGNHPIVGEIIPGGQTVAGAKSEQPSTESLAESLKKLSLDQMMLEMETTNGQFIWKIPHYDEEKRKAMDGKLSSLYSTPFRLGKYGYKFCLRAYLYGDGRGKKTHLSLFLVLMKGHFDPLLTFPLDALVTLTVVNQNDPSKSVTEKFRTNPKESNSWQRPREDLNVASGMPDIISLKQLEEEGAGYIVDDTLYLGAQVELRNGQVPLYHNTALFERESHQKQKKSTSEKQSSAAACSIQ